MLIVLIGISGSGKSTLAQKLNIETVSSDQIRKLLLGDVNDQSNGGKIFEHCKMEINAKIENRKNVIFDATNLHWKRLLNFVLDTKKTTVIFVFMQDSINLDLCKKRVQDDLANNIERSNVPMEVIERQFNNYRLCYYDAHVGITGVMNFPKNYHIFDYKNNLMELVNFIEKLK